MLDDGNNGHAAACPARPSVKSLEQAAQWYAILRDEGVTEQERQAWQAWLVRSPEHLNAWHYIEAVSRKFDPLRAVGPQGAAAAVAGAQAARRTVLSRRHAVNGLAGVLGLGLAGWLGWRHTPLPEMALAWGADIRTGTGERRDLILADGSHVWLNTDSALKVDYRDGLRRLVLLRGEILVETAPDGQKRPFHVETESGRMRALGTRFTVRRIEGRTRLDVFDGTVEIRTSSGIVRRIEAGWAALFDTDAIDGLDLADQAHEAWSRGRISADNLPLGALLEELGRYRHGIISVAPEVAGLTVMGVFPADDPDLALSMLEQSLSIRVRRTLPWWITVEAL